MNVSRPTAALLFRLLNYPGLGCNQRGPVFGKRGQPDDANPRHLVTVAPIHWWAREAQQVSRREAQGGGGVLLSDRGADVDGEVGC